MLIMIMLIRANSSNINFIYFTSLQWTIKNQGLDAVMNYGRKSSLKVVSFKTPV